MAEEQYETAVKFYPKYNYGATATLRPELVTQMNEIIDKLYDERFEELKHQNAYREVTGRQISVPVTSLPEEMSHFIFNMSKGYILNSGLHCMNVDFDKVPLAIDKIWTTDSKENDYTPVHSHFGLVAGVFYLKIPEQVSSMNDEGNFHVHHDESGYVDVNPLQSIRPRGIDLIVPEEGMFTIFPSWLKHSVSPFLGPGVRRAVSFNVICPESDKHKFEPIQEAVRERRKTEEVLKIDTAGGPDAKIQGDRDLRGLTDA